MWAKSKEDIPFNKKLKGDFRKSLNPNYDAIKPKPVAVTIPKEHVMTDYEIDKLYE